MLVVMRKRGARRERGEGEKVRERKGRGRGRVGEREGGRERR